MEPRYIKSFCSVNPLGPQRNNAATRQSIAPVGPDSRAWPVRPVLSLLTHSVLCRLGNAHLLFPHREEPMHRLRLALVALAFAASVSACQSDGVAGPTDPTLQAPSGRDGASYNIGMGGSGGRVSDPSVTTVAESDTTMTARNGGMAGSGGRVSDPSATTVAESDTTTAARNGGMAGSGH